MQSRLTSCEWHLQETHVTCAIMHLTHVYPHAARLFYAGAWNDGCDWEGASGWWKGVGPSYALQVHVSLQAIHRDSVTKHTQHMYCLIHMCVHEPVRIPPNKFWLGKSFSFWPCQLYHSSNSSHSPMPDLHIPAVSCCPALVYVDWILVAGSQVLCQSAISSRVSSII